MKTVLEMLMKGLKESDKDPFFGTAKASIFMNGDEYKVYESAASARHSNQTWMRLNFKVNGKRVRKSLLADIPFVDGSEKHISPIELLDEYIRFESFL